MPLSKESFTFLSKDDFLKGTLKVESCSPAVNVGRLLQPKHNLDATSSLQGS